MAGRTEHRSQPGSKPSTLCGIVLRPLSTMTFVKSTSAILAAKALNRPIDSSWVDWAIDMLEAGFDTEHLVIIAGLYEPFNQFQLHDWTEKALSELQLDYSDQDKTITNYASYLVESALNGEIESFKVLQILKNICIELDYKSDLYDFYRLFFAKDDLIYLDYQHYWDGADKENIDQVILDYFQKWRLDHPTEFRTTTA